MRTVGENVAKGAMMGEALGGSALDVQEGGSHYKKLKIQPVEYIHANGIGFMEGSAIKYLTRWRDKGGIEDLKKARHFIEMLIEMEERSLRQDMARTQLEVEQKILDRKTQSTWFGAEPPASRSI